MHVQRRSKLLNAQTEPLVQLLVLIRLSRVGWGKVEALDGAAVERRLTVLEVVVAALSVDALKVVAVV
jgi:hypothetical protein